MNKLQIKIYIRHDTVYAKKMHKYYKYKRPLKWDSKFRNTFILSISKPIYL